MPDKVTVLSLRAMRARGERIVCLTAYDSVLGELADTSGADLILVGDSAGNVILGHANTLPVTLNDMVHHTRATRAGVKRAFLVADLPFGTYQSSTAQAIDSAVALMRVGAEGVKLEGNYPEAVRALVNAGIPTMGHLGMTPQSVHSFGGHRVQGRGEAGSAIVDSAKRLEEAGAFAIVLELMPADLAEQITTSLSIPTIGIGAGAWCSGQIQVFHDVAGLSTQTFRHARAFVQGRDLLLTGLQEYTASVRQGTFPSEENSF